jgi:hypothetical protein
MTRPVKTVTRSGFLSHSFFSSLIFLLGFSVSWGASLAQTDASQEANSVAPGSHETHGDITIEKNSTAENDVITVGHSIFVEGRAKKCVAALGGSVTVNGAVEGDVTAFGGDVKLGDGATVDGDLIVLGGRLYHSPSAHVLGKTLATTYFHDEFQRAFALGARSRFRGNFSRTAMLWRAARVLAWFIIAVLVILFVPAQTAFAMDGFERNFAKIAVIGLLAFIVFVGLLALFSLMIKIVVGIPLVFLLMLSVFGMWAFGAVAFYLTIGRLFARWLFKRPLPLALYALLGLILWSLLSFVPIVNLFVPYLVFVCALGISLATKFGTGKPWFVRST